MIDSKKVVSHYDYIKQIALAWINQQLYWPAARPSKKRKGKEQDNKRVTRAMKVQQN